MTRILFFINAIQIPIFAYSSKLIPYILEYQLNSEINAAQYYRLQLTGVSSSKTFCRFPERLKHTETPHQLARHCMSRNAFERRILETAIKYIQIVALVKDVI